MDSVDRTRRDLSHPEGERGIVIVIVAIVLVMLLGFAGLAIDFGYAYVEKARLQAVADAAALACAQKGTCVDGPGNSSVPQNYAVLQPVDVYGAALNVSTNVTCPNDPSSTDCVMVQAQKTWSTFFVKLFTVPTLTVKTQAIAVGGSGPSPPGTAPTVLALGTNGNGLQISGYNPVVQINGDAVSNASAGIVSTASSPIITGDAYSAGPISSGIQVQGSRLEYQTPIDNPCGVVPVPAPPSQPWCPECLPSPGNVCTQNNQTVNLPAGKYSEFRVVLSRNGCTVNMSGVYFVNYDAFSIEITATNSSVLASNTMIYLNNSTNNLSFKINGNNATVNMTPSSTGSYAGILAWANGTGGTQTYLEFSTNPNTTFSLGGLIYAPNSNLLLQRQGSPDITANVSGLFARSVDIRTWSPDNVTINPPPVGVCNDGTGSSGGGAGAGGGSGSTRLVQ